MASGGDVMDILNVSRAGRGDPASLLQSPPPPKGEKERKRKPGTHRWRSRRGKGVRATNQCVWGRAQGNEHNALVRRPRARQTSLTSMLIQRRGSLPRGLCAHPRYVVLPSEASSCSSSRPQASSTRRPWPSRRRQSYPRCRSRRSASSARSARSHGAFLLSFSLAPTLFERPHSRPETRVMQADLLT